MFLNCVKLGSERCKHTLLSVQVVFFIVLYFRVRMDTNRFCLPLKTAYPSREKSLHVFHWETQITL